MNSRPRKRFGQHFLHDANIIDKILAAIDPVESDRFIEIGPGQGALTMPLLDRVARLDAVEIDRDLAATLIERITDDRFHLHRADALKFDFAALDDGSGLRVCGNLPYNISTPLLFHLLAQADSIRDMHVMLQREVVDRMAAGPGSRTYGRLSVAIAARCRVERLFTIRPGSFAPPPKVESAFVRLTPDAVLRSRIADEETFNLLITRAFNMRRKTLANALRGFASVELLERIGIDANDRPEKISVAQYVELSNAMTD